MTDDFLSIQAPIFNVQPFAVHDGPGIRTTVFVKGCPLRCLWCANPESNLAAPQLMTYASKCTGCGSCITVCPQNAITLAERRGKIAAVTDRSLCTDCGVCTAACKTEAREIAGKAMSVGEVMQQVLRDRPFYETSGGGMTVSGGECLMHPEFTEALLFAAKQEDLHTAVESCSFASREVIDRVFRYVDLGLLDIKHMNSETHKELTGVPNEVILDNIRHIHNELRVAVTVRIPVIPGYNDSDENIAATAAFTAGELGTDVPLHLLPYHRLGESKSESLGQTPALMLEVPPAEHMEHLKAIVESYGLTSQIGG